MRKKLIIALVLSVVAFGCQDNDGKPSTGWGINSSSKDNASNAIGSIDHQNAGPKFTYWADTAYVVPLYEHHHYQVTFKFRTLDSLRLIIEKNTNDFNYHFEAPLSQNRLLYAIFNSDTLALKESALSIQPRDNNTFTTVTNVHTLYDGDLNGTIDNVILISR